MRAWVQGEEGQWVAQEQLREKLMARVSDRPLVDLVLSTAPNKLTSKGAIYRHCSTCHQHMQPCHFPQLHPWVEQTSIILALLSELSLWVVD